MWRWLLLVFALSFCFFAVQSGDVLMYLSLARDFVLHGNFAQIDPYVYSATDHQLIWAHEYLSYLAFFGAWKALGAAGLIILKALALGLMFWSVLQAKPRAFAQSPLWMMLWTLAVLAGSFRFIERASMFSDLFTVVLAVWLLEKQTIDRKLIVGLTLMFALWAQLHPGFVVGVIFLIVWALWRRPRHAGWLLVPVAALLLNPEGLSGALYPIRFALNEAATLRAYNFEWFPAIHPAFRFAPEVIAFWILSFACTVLFIKERVWRSRELALRAGFAFISFALTVNAVRFMPWAAMVLVLSVKPIATFSLPRLQRPIVRYAMAALLAGVAICNFCFGYQSSSGRRLAHFGFDPKFFPTTTLDFLRRQPIPGRLYNSHDFGSSLIWNQMTPVFHHGFVTDMRFYRDEVMGAMRSREEFQKLAEKYGWTMLLVDKYDGYRAMYAILSPLPEWKIVAEDDASYLIYKLP